MATNELGAVFSTSGYKDVYSDIYGPTLFTARLSAGELRVTAIEVVGYYSTAVSLTATIAGGSTVTAASELAEPVRGEATFTGTATFVATLQGQGVHFDTDVKLLIEVAFDSDPFDENPAWTDISPYVRSFNIARGRQHELDRIETGTMSMLLDNRDRRFEPGNSGSPYYSNVVPMKRVRVTAQHGGTDYRRFDGYITRWPQKWPGEGKDSTVEISAVDGLGLVAQTDFPSPVAAEILQNVPRGYWPLTDTEASTWDDLSNNNRPGVSRNVTLGDGLISQESAAVFDPTTTPGPAVEFPAGTAITGTGAFSVSVWLNIESLPLDEGYVYAQRPTSGSLTGQLLLVVTSTGKIRFFTGTTNGGSTLSNSALPVNEWHHVAVTRDSSGVQRIYINGSLDKSSGALTASDLQDNLTILGVFVWGTEGRERWFDGRMAHLATYDLELSASRIAAHYVAGKTGWDGDRTDTRIARLLNAARWPTNLRTLNTGLSKMPAITGSFNVLDQIKSTVLTERGNGFIDNAGVFVFHNRHWRYTQTAGNTSQTTFNRYRNLEFGYDDYWLINQSTVKSDPKTAVYQNATSIGSYTPHTRSETLDLYDGNDAPARARWLVDRYKDPQLRVQHLELVPQETPATLWAQTLARVQDERVTTVRNPPGGGQITQDVHIERVEDYVQVGREWVTRFELSPPDDTQYWVLGDATNGKLGSTTRIAY